MTNNPGQGTMGTKIYMTVSGTPTQIVHAEKISFPELEKVLNETTTHDSAGGYAEFGDTGKKKANSFPLGLRWDKNEATHAALLTAFASEDPTEFKVEDPDGDDPMTFYAHVQKLGRVTEQEGVFRMNVTLQPTGQPS